MCKPKNGTTLETIYDDFIKDIVSDLKNYGSAIVFRPYHIKDIKKQFPNIKVKQINNFYQIRL